jgi:hypothetical protein
MLKQDAEYVLERIESMLRLLETRAGSEDVKAAAELNRFRSRVRKVLSEESATKEDDIETAFYELLENQRTLGLAFLDAMEIDVNKLV